VAVTTFASHLHRVAAIIEASIKAGRKVMLVGKAMREAVALGNECGIIDYPPETFLNQSEYPKLEDKMVTVIASGSQGEAYSAMTQIAYGEHGHVDLEEGDVAIFSARHIPGNEQAISRAVNALVSRGVKVYTEIDGVHASGHGHREELAKFIELLRPKYFVPIHGQPIQRVAHRDIALEKGLLKENTFILCDGKPLDFFAQEGEIIPYPGEPVAASYLSVDGKVIGDICEQVLADRRDLSEHGVLFCSLVLDERGYLLVAPKVTARGLILLKDNDDFFAEAAANIMEFWPTLSPAERFDDEAAFMEIKRVSRSFIKARLGRRPLVAVIIHRLGEEPAVKVHDEDEE
jgi:ribonuclease J